MAIYLWFLFFFMNNSSSSSSPDHDSYIQAFHQLRLQHQRELDALLARHAKESAELEESTSRVLRSLRSVSYVQTQPALSRSGVTLQAGDIVSLCTSGRSGKSGDKARLLSRTKNPEPAFNLQLLKTKTVTQRNAENLDFIRRP